MAEYWGPEPVGKGTYAGISRAFTSVRHIRKAVAKMLDFLERLGEEFSKKGNPEDAFRLEIMMLYFFKDASTADTAFFEKCHKRYGHLEANETSVRAWKSISPMSACDPESINPAHLLAYRKIAQELLKEIGGSSHEGREAFVQSSPQKQRWNLVSAVEKVCANVRNARKAEFSDFANSGKP